MENEDPNEYVYLGLKIIGILIVIALFVLIGASQIKPNPISSQVYDQLTSSSKYLEDNKSAYASCYSNTQGMLKTKAELQLATIAGFQNKNYDLEKLNQSYFNKLDSLCRTIMSDYERAYVRLVKANEDKDKSEQTLLDKIFKNEPESVQDSFTLLDKARDFSATEYVINPDDVSQYY